MILALDFDGTFTAMSWFCVIPHFEAQGHKIITVTSRRNTFENEQVMRAAGVTWPIVFAYDQPKAMAAKEAGYDISQIIWIDDAPQTIGKGDEILAVESVWERELRHCYEKLTTEHLPIKEFGELVKRLRTVCGD